MHSSRRSFLRITAALGAAALPVHAEDDPFATLPPELWRNSRRNGLIMIRRPIPHELSWRKQIVSDQEPGEPLVVSGRVYAPDGRTPLPGIKVFAYNTDVAGNYSERTGEYAPRIHGWLITDRDGRFEVRTIRPGHYPNMRIPAHIHFTLCGAGYPPQWAEELRFKGDPYLTSADVAADIVKNADGVWACSYDIQVQRATNFTA